MSPALAEHHKELVDAGLARWYKTARQSRRVVDHVTAGMLSKDTFSIMNHVMLSEAVAVALVDGLELMRLAQEKGLSETADMIFGEMVTLARANEILLHLTETMLEEPTPSSEKPLTVSKNSDTPVSVNTQE